MTPRFVALALLPLAFIACAKEIVAHKQPEAEAIEIVTLLAKEGIEAQKLRDEESRELAFNVQVAKDDEKRAYELMIQHHLPRTEADGTAKLLGEGGMIPTPAQETAKREAGVAGDITNRLRGLPRVIDVRVLVSIPKDDPLRDVNEAKPRPKASVVLTYLPDAKNLPPVSVEAVQNFVQAALPELKPTEVAVLLIPSTEPVLKSAGESGTPGAPAVECPTNVCEKVSVIGIEVCIDQKRRLLNSLVGVLVVAGVLAGLVVVSVLRAMRYRKDLTRLTAQVAQLKK